MILSFYLLVSLYIMLLYFICSISPSGGLCNSLEAASYVLSCLLFMLDHFHSLDWFHSTVVITSLLFYQVQYLYLPIELFQYPNLFQLLITFTVYVHDHYITQHQQTRTCIHQSNHSYLSVYIIITYIRVHSCHTLSNESQSTCSLYLR